jgi:capsid protein
VVDLQSGGPVSFGGENYSRISQSSAIFAPGKYWRTAMLRSVPELHAVVGALQDDGETNANVQSKIKFESMLFTVERKGALGTMPGSKFAARGGTGQSVEVSDADYGMRFQTTGEPDKDFRLSNMNNPGAQHVPYMEHSGRRIASGVGLPYEIVAHLYTNGSYTANRAARTDFKKFLYDRWEWRNKVLNQRVWNWVIARAMKNKEIRQAPVNASGRSLWHKCTWTLPHFPQIDEGKEIAADVRKWGALQDSIGDWGRESNRSREQLLNAHDRDIRDMKERAESLGVTLAEYAGELFKASAAAQENQIEEAS